MNPIKRVPLHLIAAVAFVAVLGSVVLAKAISGAGGRPGLVTPLAFMVLFVATITLLAVAIVTCQRLVDEMDAAHPLKVRNRGALFRLVRRVCRWGFGLGARASRAWLRWVSAAIAVLQREVKRVCRWGFGLGARASRAWLRWVSAAIAVLQREVTRDALERRGRAAALALCGVPPDDVAPLPDAGRLARPERPEAPHRTRRTRPLSHHRVSPRSGPPRSQLLSTLARLTDQARRRDQRART